jgi:hypothetical protein
MNPKRRSVSYEKSILTYIDILGFSELITNKSAGDISRSHGFPSTLWSEPLPIGDRRLDSFTIQIRACSTLAGNTWKDYDTMECCRV